MPHERLHLHRHPLLERIEVEHTGAELVLGPVRTDIPPPWRPPSAREGFAALRRPEIPTVPIRVRNLVVEDEHAARLEVPVDPFERLHVLGAGAAYAERAAHEDRPVATRNIELVLGLRVEAGREALALGRLPG